MKRSILFSVIAMIALASCQQKEDFTLPVEGELMTFYASIMDDATKTTAELDQENNQTKVLWAEGDAYAMSVKGGKFAEFTLDSEAGLNTGTFSGTAAEGVGTQNIAYYPYADGITITDDKLNVVFPAGQAYTENCIAAAPMVAVSENNTLQFKNVASLVKITLKGTATIKTISLTGNNNEVIAGNATVTLGETSSLSINEGETTKTITLNCGDGIALTSEGVDFYFAVPARTFTQGFTVVATDSENKTMTKTTTNEVALTASKVKILPAFTYEANTTSVSSAEAFLTAVAKGGTITLDKHITIPANTEIKSGVIIDGAGFNVTTECTVTDGVGKGVFTLAGGTIKNVNFTSPNTQYDIIVTAGGSTIEDCNFLTPTATEMGKGKRAIYTLDEDLTGKLTVNNCEFDDQVYAFNFSTAKTQMDIAFNNCTLGGWLSGHGTSHTFTSCTFKASGEHANYVPYCDASFVKCTFEDGFKVSLAAAGNYEAEMVFDNESKYNNITIDSPAIVQWDLSGDSEGTEGKTVTVTIGDNEYTATIGANETFTWSNLSE